MLPTIDEHNAAAAVRWMRLALAVVIVALAVLVIATW
jgi:hypothetical protein